MSLEKDRILTLAHEGYGNAKQALTIALQAVEGGRTSPNTRSVREVGWEMGDRLSTGWPPNIGA
jgi:hypothetical protein